MVRPSLTEFTLDAAGRGESRTRTGINMAAEQGARDCNAFSPPVTRIKCYGNIWPSRGHLQWAFFAQFPSEHMNLCFHGPAAGRRHTRHPHTSAFASNVGDQISFSENKNGFAEFYGHRRHMRGPFLLSKSVGLKHFYLIRIFAPHISPPSPPPGAQENSACRVALRLPINSPFTASIDCE